MKVSYEKEGRDMTYVHRETLFIATPLNIWYYVDFDRVFRFLSMPCR